MHNDSAQVIGDKRLAALYAYWLGKRGHRPMPGRADIDPTEIPTLLPIIVLLDVVAPDRFRYRLIGTEIVRSVGKDSTGKWLHDVLPDGAYREYIIGLVTETATACQALYAEGVFMAEGRVERQVRRLLLPLSADGRTIDMIISGQTTMATSKDAANIVRSEGLPFAEKLRRRLA